MPDLRLYRVALLVAVVLAAASLLALRPPQAVTLSTQPTAFDASDRGGRHAGRWSPTSPAASPAHAADRLAGSGSPAKFAAAA